MDCNELREGPVGKSHQGRASLRSTSVHTAEVLPVVPRALTRALQAQSKPASLSPILTLETSLGRTSSGGTGWTPCDAGGPQGGLGCRRGLGVQPQRRVFTKMPGGPGAVQLASKAHFFAWNLSLQQPHPAGPELEQSPPR